jgi:hypothetical protein
MASSGIMPSVLQERPRLARVVYSSYRRANPYTFTSTSQAGNTTQGSATVTDLASTAGLAAGESVTGPGIPALTTVLSLAGSSITLSNPATATATSVPLTFGDQGAHTYSVTFSQPGGQKLIAAGGGGTGSGGIVVTPGPYDLSRSTVSVTPQVVPARGQAAVTLTVRDALGNQEASGGLTNVAFAVGAGSIGGGNWGVTTDNNDGTYTAIFTAGTLAGLDNLTATIDGAPLTSSPASLVVTPAITSVNNTTFVAGTPSAFTFTEIGTATPTWTESGALPAGVTFDASTGTLGGTPAAGSGGTYGLLIGVAGGGGAGTQQFTLTVDQAPAIVGASAASFTVGSAGSLSLTTPSGTYPRATFSETGNLPAGVTLSSAGLLSGTPAAGTRGAYNIVVTASNGVSPDATLSFTLTVNPAGSTTTVVSSPAASVAGQPVTLTATVAPGITGGAEPTGAVTFSAGGQALGTAFLAPGSGGTGTAAFTTLPGQLPAGNLTITATYNGDGSYGGSAGTAGQRVSKANTTMSLRSSAAPGVLGQSITFTARVSAVAPGAGNPAGGVNFYRGSVSPLNLLNTTGPVPLVDGAAALSVSTLPLGRTTIIAAYAGDANYNAPANAAVAQQVNKITPAVTVNASVSPSVWGQAVTLTADVSAAAPGSGIPTGAAPGTVVFRRGNIVLNAAPVKLVNGRATLSLPGTALPVGANAITASYSGNAAYLPGAGSLSQAVNRASTSVTAVTASWTPASAPPRYGQAVTFTALVSALAPGGGTPAGTVTFRAGGVALGTVNVTALGAGVARAVLTTTRLPAGVGQTITATYNGAAAYAGSSAQLPQPLTVAQVGTKTTLGGLPGSVTAGQPITFTATVASVITGRPSAPGEPGSAASRTCGPVPPAPSAGYAAGGSAGRGSRAGRRRAPRSPTPSARPCSSRASRSS